MELESVTLAFFLSEDGEPLCKVKFILANGDVQIVVMKITEDIVRFMFEKGDAICA